MSWCEGLVYSAWNNSGLENDFIIYDIRRFDLKIDNNVDNNQIEIFNMICKNAKSICNRHDGLSGGADGIKKIQWLGTENHLRTQVLV